MRVLRRGGERLYPFPLQEALTEAALDLCQGKLEHGRRAPEDARDAGFPSYNTHQDTLDGLIGRRGIRRDEGVGHAREFCMAFVRECGIDLITVLDGDSGSIPESLPDLIRLLQVFQAFQDSLLLSNQGPGSFQYHSRCPDPIPVGFRQG